MKRHWSASTIGLVAMAILALVILPGAGAKKENQAVPLTLIGKSACAQCDGIASGHHIALKADNGLNFVLIGDGDAYKAVHKVRKEGKRIEATLEGPIQPKDKNGAPYLEAKVSSIKVISIKAPTVTISGTSACAQCTGIASKGHDVALKADNGVNFVLKGQGDDYQAIHKVRQQGKKIIATLVGSIKPKANDAGEPYLEAEISSIKLGT